MDELAFSGIFDAAPAPIALVDGALRYVLVNARMAELNARPKHDHVGRPVAEIDRALGELLGRHLESIRDRGEPLREVRIGPTDRALHASVFRLIPAGSAEPLIVVAGRGVVASSEDLLARLRFEEMIAQLAQSFVDVTAEHLDGVLGSSLATIGDALGADSVVVHEATDLVGIKVSRWTRGGGPEPLDDQAMTGATFSWSAGELLAGRTILAHSADELPAEARAERERSRTHPGAFATVPLRVGEHLLGAITVRWVAARPEWSASLRARLGLIGQLVSTALHRRVIEREAEEGRRFDAFLARISTRLIEVEGERLDDAIRDAMRALGTDRGVDRVHLRDVDALGGARLISRYEWRSPAAPPSGHDEALDALPFLAGELRAGRAFVVRRPDHLPVEAAPERRWLEANGVRSQVIVPLRVGDELLGALGLDAIAEPRSWSGPFLARLQLVGEIFANALHRRRAERVRVEASRFDELLGVISNALIDAPGERLDEVLRVALDQIRERLDVVRVLLLEIDRDDRSYRIVLQAGAEGPYVNGSRHPVMPGLFERTIETGFLILRTHDLPDPVLREAWLAAGVSTSATIVLCRGERSFGLLTLVSRDPAAFQGDFGRRAHLLQDVLGSALARRDAELARRRAFEELAQLKARIERERDYLREEIRLDHDVCSLVAESRALERVLEHVDAVAPTTATVLIRGETGVGKELIARAIHARSPRADAPLVKVNCASIPRDLFDSEFFGHVRGSFTGAHRDRAGRFELADKGTIFLDEVGEIPLELQAKLLRVLQEGEIERVGDDRVRRVDVRIVAATNRDLEEDIAAGRFRRDLYYRLSVFPIDVPPLRERREDILPLARHYIERFGKEMNRRGLTLSDVDEERLVAYAWPGNVRELAHTIERAVILSARPPLRLDLALPRVDRAPSVASVATPSDPIRTDAQMRALERSNVIAALERAAWRVGGAGGAAEILGVSPSTLRDRMRAFDIAPPDATGRSGPRRTERSDRR